MLHPSQARFQPETYQVRVGTGAVSVELGNSLGRKLAPARVPAHPVPRVRAMTEAALRASKRPDKKIPPLADLQGLPLKGWSLDLLAGPYLRQLQDSAFPRFWSLGL
jgi:hypothetical protein